MANDHELTGDVQIHLFRFLNKRFVTFSVDVLEAVFLPYAKVAITDAGEMILKFSETCPDVKVLVDSIAASRRRTFRFTIDSSKSNRAIWAGVFEIMRSDNVMLLSPLASTAVYAKPGAPGHFNKDMLDSSAAPVQVSSISSLMQTLRLGNSQD